MRTTARRKSAVERQRLLQSARSGQPENAKRNSASTPKHASASWAHLVGPLREAVGVSLHLELDVPPEAAAVKARLRSSPLPACQRNPQSLSMTLRPRPSLRAVGHLHVLVPQTWNSLYVCRVDRIHQAAEGLHPGAVGLADGPANPIRDTQHNWDLLGCSFITHSARVIAHHQEIEAGRMRGKSEQSPFMPSGRVPTSPRSEANLRWQGNLRCRYKRFESTHACDIRSGIHSGNKASSPAATSKAD